jgi:hypothetical protein
MDSLKTILAHFAFATFGYLVSINTMFAVQATDTLSAPERLKAGFAERDITPDLGMERPSGYSKQYHREFHDPCKVRVAVFDDGHRSVALVSVDALLVRRVLVQAARTRIAQQTGLSPEAILIHATHSHSSGPTGNIYPNEYDHASQEIQDLAYIHSTNANLSYVQRVEDQIVAAVTEAYRRYFGVVFCQRSAAAGCEDAEGTGGRR